MKLDSRDWLLVKVRTNQFRWAYITSNRQFSA